MTDLVRAEWQKVRSLRSNRYLLLASLLTIPLTAGVAYLIIRGWDAQSAADRLRFDAVGDGIGTGLPVAYFLFAAMGALTVTAEYGTGMINTSMLAVPRRRSLLLAKAISPAVVALVAGPLLTFAMYGAAQAVFGDRAAALVETGETLGGPPGEPGVLLGVLVAGLAAAPVALIGLGLGALLRSTAGTLVALLVVLFVLPVAARTLPDPLNAQAGSFMIDALPYQLVSGDGLRTPAQAALLLALYPALAMAAGATAITVRGLRLRTIGVGAAVAVLLGVLTVPAAAAPASATAGLDWKRCEGKNAPAEMRCATVTVPLDWSKPQGRKLRLPVAVLPADGTRRRLGTVLHIPGGPGGSGVADLERAGAAFAGLRRSFDVLSLTPRNSPDLGMLPMSCATTGSPATMPADRAGFARLAESNRRGADRCRAKDPEYFDNLDSASVARDLDAIRAALGEDRLTLMATSYGGVPAVNYARRFPERVRALYLDGVLNPLLTEEQADRLRYPRTEQDFRRFTDWCAGSTACVLHGEDVGKVWRSLVARAERDPIPVRGEQERFSGWDLKITISPFIKGKAADPTEGWREAAKAIDRARDGDASDFADIVRQRNDAVKLPFPPYQYAVECADQGGYASYAEFAAARERGERLSPNFAGLWQRSPLGCVGWPPPRRDARAALPADRLPPMLGAGTWEDSAGMPSLLAQVPGSVMLRYEGHGHGLYLSGDPCTIAHANRYLTTLRLPAPNTTCRPEG